MNTSRRLAAIMFTDIAGYTAMMQENEARAVQIRQRHREVFERLHQKYRGQIIQYYGDGTLSIFESAVDAATCAADMQLAFQEEPQVPLRIGIHVGDIMVSETEAIGDGVNVASRVESMAVPGSVLVSDTLFDNIKNQKEFPAESLGIFTFKNVAKPVEVFALASKGLEVPDPKKLSGKYIKRESGKKDWFSRQPIWVKYVVGFVLFLILAPFIYSPITGLFDAGAAPNMVEFTDENGNTITRQVIPKEQRKDLFLSTFENKTGDSTNYWMGSGLPYAMELDFDQDPYTYNKYDEGSEVLPLNELIEQSKVQNFEYLILGSYATVEEGIEGTVKVYALPNGQLQAEITRTASNILPLADSLTFAIKREIGLPEEHLESYTDLSLSSVLTQSPEAYQSFIEGIIALKNQQPDLFSKLEQPMKQDPTFAWASFNYANMLYYFQRSPNLVRQYLDQAMEHMGRMPEIFSLSIKQLHYKVNDQPEKALKLASLMTQMEPEKASHWSALIRESYLLNEYDVCINALHQYRQLQDDPDYERSMEARCYLWLGEIDKGLAAIERHLKSQPKDQAGILMKGQFLLAQEKVEEARTVFEQGSFLFDEPDIWERMLRHCDYVEEHGQMTKEDAARYLGQYWVQGLSSFRIYMKYLVDHLVIKSGKQPNIILYPLGDHEFAMVYDATISFTEDSLAGNITHLIMTQASGVRFTASYVDSGLVSIYDAFKSGEHETALSLIETYQPDEETDSRFIDAMQTYLSRKEDLELTEEAAKPYLGEYRFDQVAYRLIWKEQALHMEQITTSMGVEPSRMYPAGEGQFFILENHKTLIKLDNTASGMKLGFELFARDTTQWSEPKI